MTLKDNIQKLAQVYHPEIVALRRHIHQNPELSFEEHETGKYVAAQLQKWGIAHQTGVAGTGVVALIEGKNPGKNTVALRADMDALPIIEANEVSYKSQNLGGTPPSQQPRADERVGPQWQWDWDYLIPLP